MSSCGVGGFFFESGFGFEGEEEEEGGVVLEFGGGDSIFGERRSVELREPLSCFLLLGYAFRRLGAKGLFGH